MKVDKFDFEQVKNSINANISSFLLTEGYRGETSLRQFICDLLHKFCYVYVNDKDVVLHHLDNNHFNNNVENISLLIKDNQHSNPNATVHNSKQMKNLNKYNVVDYADFLATATTEINVWKSICSGRLVNSKGISIVS